MMARKLILYIAMSLDGYIARKDDDLSWLSVVENEGEDYGYGAFISTVDTVILGKRTYDKVLSMGYDFPHADKESYIITRTPQPSVGNVHFYTEDLPLLVQQLKRKEGKNIFCDGGATVVHQLMKDHLIDEIIVSVIPILLGDGIRLFQADMPEHQLTLLSAKAFDKGLVQLHYSVSSSHD